MPIPLSPSQEGSLDLDFTQKKGRKKEVGLADSRKKRTFVPENIS